MQHTRLPCSRSGGRYPLEQAGKTLLVETYIWILKQKTFWKLFLDVIASSSTYPLSVGQWVIDSFRLEIAIASPSFASLFVFVTRRHPNNQEMYPFHPISFSKIVGSLVFAGKAESDHPLLRSGARPENLRVLHAMYFCICYCVLYFVFRVGFGIYVLVFARKGEFGVPLLRSGAG